MIGVGGIIGAIIGFKIANIIGMFVGFYIGQHIEKNLSRFSGGSSNKEAIQDSFFNALFLNMGRIAKADGVVSSKEIQRVEAIFNHMRLTPELRKKAIQLFEQGKNGGQLVRVALSRFAQLSRNSLSLRQIFLEMLIDVAEADGKLDGAEWQVIDNACDVIRYPKPLLIAMLKMRGFTHNQSSSRNSSSGQGHHGYSRNSTQGADPFTTLGVNRSDDKATIRKAYKKLMSQHHPDKLIAKGLPPEMVKVAEEKAKKIQAAWEEVKQVKGF